MGLRGARLGWLLGLGPGGERVAVAVAHDDRVPALGDGPGEARHAQEVEPGADHRVLAALDLRHVSHPLRRDLVGALVHAVAGRLLVPGLPRPRGRGELRTVRDADAAAGGGSASGVDGEPRGGLPLQ